MRDSAPFSLWVTMMPTKSLLLKLAPPAFVFASLLIAVNLHLPDLGETYVTRNLFAWGFMALCLLPIWWQPLRNGTLRWHKDWLIGFGLPIIGAFFVLVVNILGGYDELHLGHYFLPGMLTIVALFVFGLLQHDFSDTTWANLLIAAMAAFLPQYVVHVVATNPVVFFAVTIEIKQIFFKDYAGFGQYNLYGSFLSSTLLLLFWAATSLSISPAHRVILLALLFIYALDLPSLPSKTALIGFIAGLIFLALHIGLNRSDRMLVRRSLLGTVVLLSAIAIATGFMLHEAGLVSRSTRWTMEGNSVQTRFAMWVIAWRGFLEAPIFGHGLGGYTQLYTEHFARYGLAEGLQFYPTVSLPHNLILHLLSESGLFGTCLLLGPFIYFGARILKHNQNRFLVLALCAPVLVHSQLEYPYIASAMHYLVLCVGLVAAMSSSPEMSKSRQLPAMPYGIWAGYSAIGVVSIIALAAVANMQLTITRTAKHLLPTLSYLWRLMLHRVTPIQILAIRSSGSVCVRCQTWFWQDWLLMQATMQWFEMWSCHLWRKTSYRFIIMQVSGTWPFEVIMGLVNR